MPVLTLAEFLDTIPFLAWTIDLSASVEVRATSGGRIDTVEHGARYWFGTIAAGTREHGDAERIAALVRRLQRSDMEFELSPVHHDGRNSTVTNGTLSAVANGRDVSFAGVGASQSLAAGRFFSLVYGGRPRLHQLGTGGTSTSGGAAGPFEALPDLEPGYTIGQAVTWVRPVLHAKIVPGTVRPYTFAGRTGRGLEFEWRQQLI